MPRLIHRCFFAALVTVTACTTAAPVRPLITTSAITQEDVRSRIYLIADDSMNGRAAGERGNFIMTSYVAREMQRLGLEPGGENGTFFQTVPMVRRSIDSSSTITVSGQRLAPLTDFAPIRPTPTLRFSPALPSVKYETVYGGRLGDSTIVLTPDEVSGHVIVFDAPLSTNGQPTGTYSTPAAAAIARYPAAAAFLLTVIDVMTPASLSSLRSRGVGIAAQSNGMHTPFGIAISRRASETILGAPMTSAKPGSRGNDAQIDVRFVESAVEAPARNVIAIVRGSDPQLRNEYVAIGAHSDHLPNAAHAVDHDSLKAYNRVMRPFGGDTRVATNAVPNAEQAARISAILDSLRKIRRPRRDSIYNGADDDGSGSTALLEIAENLAAAKPPRRSILLVWHTGEEAGLLGSSWFTEHTTVPHDSIVAQINMDMVGRGEKVDNPVAGPRYIQVIGSRRLSTDLGNVLDSVNSIRQTPYDIDYSFDAPHQIQNRYCRSDHYMYARTGIPIAYISRGYHPDYHMVTDEPQYISYTGLANVAGFVRDIALGVANRNDRVRVDKAKPNPLAPCQQ